MSEGMILPSEDVVLLYPLADIKAVWVGFFSLSDRKGVEGWIVGGWEDGVLICVNNVTRLS
uniref:Uncharacterized protein n=1 Tax=Timema poppense TaxID=170557 RepID=A0A7R9D7U4_TIMPO|nr:unnamed protein product [Timema poppensis]